MSTFIQDKADQMPKPDMEYITNEADAWEAMAFIDRYPSYAVDTETTALDPYEAKWSLLQIGVPGKSFVFDVRYDTDYSSLHPKVLNPLLQDESKLKLFQNAAYDMKIIKVNLGYYIRNVYDTMLAEQLLNLGLFTKANLQALVLRYLGWVMPKEPRLTFANYLQEFKPYQLEYAANDVVPLHDIRDLQIKRLKKEQLIDVYQLEIDFLVPLCEMELNGISIDVERWRSMMDTVKQERDETEKVIHKLLKNVEDQQTMFGVSLININSQKQLKESLSKYGLPLENTSESELAKYKGVPVIDALLDYRKANKLISTYAESLLEKISKHTGRLHTDFRQMVSTGRLSSSNPNLQNIPHGQVFRSCFVAKEGYVLLTADMSSAELRILGNFSNDPVFIECFKHGIDLHTRSASEIFKVALEEVDKKMRGACKALSFGLMYGLSKFGLSKRLKISEKEAQDLIDNYFDVFKSVKRYLDKSASDGVSKGYSKSVAGRRRYYNKPAYDNPDKNTILRGIKRQAMNMPIQSCLVAGTKINGLGSIENYVGKRVKLETGFGTDYATGVYSGKREVYDLKLSNGSMIGITDDHIIPVVTPTGYEEKFVRDINFDKDYLLIPLAPIDGKVTQLNDYIYATKGGHCVEFTTPKYLTPELSFVIGCLIGDGNYSNDNHIRFCATENQSEVLYKFNNCIENIFKYKPVVRAVIKDGYNIPLMTSQVSSVVIRGFLKHIGLDYVTGLDKSIPTYFHTDTIENKGALLNGLFSTDGGMTHESGPNYTTVSESLANDIHILLFSLGINSNLKTYIEKGSIVYRLQIPKRFNTKFKELIGFSVNIKTDVLNDNLDIPKNGGGSLVPDYISKIIAHDLIHSGVYSTLSINDKAHVRQFKKGRSSFHSWRKFYNKMGQTGDKKDLEKYLNFDFCKAVSLVYRGKEDVYDLMCDNIHYFTASGVVVHNSNADTIKKAMIYTVKRLEEKQLPAKLILTVHDEVVVEVKNGYEQEVAVIVEQCIKDGFGAYFSDIPMETDVLEGPCWLKDPCEACGCKRMVFVKGPDGLNQLICSKCSALQE